MRQVNGDSSSSSSTQTNGTVRNQMNGSHSSSATRTPNGVSNGAVTADLPEPLAIIGLSCRFPGDAVNPEKFWDLCARGQSAWSPIPEDRFNTKSFYHPQGDKQNTTNVVGGHFLKEDLALFDAGFFNMPSEIASTMDPQCRLQFESVFEALENAGIPLDKAAGSDTSVYAGSFFRDWMDSYMRDPEAFPRYVVTGNSANMLSNRISHWFDFRGPSMTVDTGCSSGLTALHLACQSLRNGESSMSIVGGANVMFNPDVFVLMSNLGFLSPDGKSYAFDSRANGYGRGEGVATLVLKTLSAALKDGDPVRAVIRETGLNQDGKTATITSPSQSAQEELIRSCYNNIGVDPKTVTYVEAHGTGTQAGDPIEAGAIGNTFGGGRRADEPLFVGSVKTNIGHLEPASGFASMIKVVLALEKGLIPPSINFKSPNPKLDLESSSINIPSKLVEWPQNVTKRASINNFGYGGTNSHVIMEKAETYSPPKMSNGVSNGATERSDSEERSRIFVLSGKDQSSTKEMLTNLKSYLGDRNLGSRSLDNLAYTLAERRSVFDWTAAVPATNADELISAIEDETVVLNRSLPHQPRLGFVFTGQGAQWYGMGRELIGAYHVFSETLREADAYLKKFGADYSLVYELTRDENESRVNDPILSPPLCVAVQIALVRLLESWGILPSAVTSHSSGEIAAAYAAGAIDLHDAMFIVFSRGIFLDALRKKSSRQGGMIAVGMGRIEAQKWIDETAPGSLVVACVNSSASVTVSGDMDAINELSKKLVAEKIFARKLKVDVAYHSHHMEPLAKDYLNSLKQGLKRPHSFRGVTYSSPVSGEVIAGSQELTADHWVKNMLQPVLFDQSLEAICHGPDGQAVDLLLEIGPHSALAGPVRQILASPSMKKYEFAYGSALVREQDAVDTIHSLVSLLITKGYRINLRPINLPNGMENVRVVSDLPSYPWSHKVRYWTESPLNVSHRFKSFPYHDLLGAQVNGGSTTAPSWRHHVRASEVPWVHDHLVQSDIIYPGAGFISMAIEAIKQITPREETSTGFLLENIEIGKALVVPDNIIGAEVYLTLNPYSKKDISRQGWFEFSIYSDPGTESFTEHCRGDIALYTENGMPDLEYKLFSRKAGFLVNPINPRDLYKSLHSVGIFHGQIFQNLHYLQASNGQSFGKFAIADVASTMPGGHQQPHVIHPTTLDSVFQAAYAALPGIGSKSFSPMVPRSIKKLYIAGDIRAQPKQNYEVHSTLQKLNDQGFEASIVVPGATSGPAIILDTLMCQSLGDMSDSSPEGKYENKVLTTRWALDLSANPATHWQNSLTLEPIESEQILEADLRRACYYYIHDALRSLTPEDIGDLEWHHKSMLDWMYVIEEQASKNKLGENSSSWYKDSDAVKAKFQDRTRDASIDGQMSCRVGEALVPIFRKETAPLELMLEGGLLYDYYKQALRIDRSYTQIEKLVDSVAHRNPKAKILEIGGGTGGCTGHVLKVLGGGNTALTQRFESYMFTDVSSGFFEKAREQFGAWGSAISYTKLDIELDPITQGLEGGSYDLILACQVLHATKNMKNTMQNVRKLLKPGGKLIMIETTNDSIDMQIIFGTLPGWWLSEEPERKNSPSLSIDMWERVLRESGFSGLDIALRDCEHSDYTMSALLTTASSSDSEVTPFETVVIKNGHSIDSNQESLLLQELTSLSGRNATIQELENSSVDGKVCIFIDDGPVSILQSMGSTTFTRVQKLLLSADGVVWVTRGSANECSNPSGAIVTGLLRTLRCENSQNKYISLDLDSQRNKWAHECTNALSRILALTHAAESGSLDNEFKERDSLISIPRILEDQFITEEISDSKHLGQLPFFCEKQELRLEAANAGALDSLVFKPVEAPNTLPSDFVEIKPMAFGLNFRDVMVALGQLDTSVMGFECSGIITKLGDNVSGFEVGQKVCGLINGHWASTVRVNHNTIVPLPTSMSFEEGASVPMAFGTAYYSLVEIARLQPGETVLIHSGAGGVGQAAIMLAQNIGAEVFVTVGSEKKRDMLYKAYNIPYGNILFNRDPSFPAEIKRLTKDQGVDVILNSLAGPLLSKTWNCIAAFGRFVEIGKRDLEANNSLDMKPFIRNVTFSSVDMLTLGKQKPKLVGRMLRDIMRLIHESKVSIVSPISTYSISEIESCFRQMQTGKHVGKIIVTTDSKAMVKVMPAPHTVKLSNKATYVVVGGAGGLGREITKLLVERGARYLIILSRNAQSVKNNDFFVNLRSAGCDISVRSCDIADQADLKRALRECKGMPPIKGVIQGAMVLQDSVFESMTYDNWQTAFAPKVTGTWNLHEYFLSNPEPLDFFILLSSLTGVAGNASQANYAAGGSFQDALARYRSSLGLPGVALDLGMVRSVGYVAETAGVADRMQKNGYRFVEVSQVLGLVEAAILNPIRSTDTAQVAIGIVSGPGADWGSAPWRDDRRFSALRQALESNTSGAGAGRSSNQTAELKMRLAAVEEWHGAVELVAGAVVSKLASMFSLKKEDIDSKSRLSKYGVDSLVAVELRNWLSHTLQGQLSIFEIMQSSSLMDLADKVARKSKLVGEKVKGGL